MDAALQAAADGIIFVDRHGRVSFLNPAAERLSGWTSSAAVGRSLPEVLQPVHVESGARLPLPLAQAMAERDALPLPSGAALQSGAGEPLAVDGAVVPVLDERGDACGAVVVLHDVSERRRARERVLGADRLAAIGALAAAAGNEVEAPLTAEGTERVARIVRQLRGWSREPSADDDRPRALDLSAVLEGALAMATPELRRRGRVIREYGVAPPVLAGELRLKQLLTILLLNTARSLPPGGDHQIRVWLGRDEHGAAVIEVHDSVSVGRDELGLATVRSLAASLDAQVEATAGAVRVVLPPAVAEGSGEVFVRRPPARAARRVLIVDDEPLICGAVQRALAPEYQVTTFTSAQAALASIAAGDAYDALLVDLLMPGMSGMDLYAEIARVAPERAARVVFLTGGAFTRRAGEFLKQVGNRRLEKPFDTRSLKAVLEEIVG
jgi:PAS domain S-box-containing protein